MGLDARTLGMREDMRFWHDAGLRHVLCAEDVAALEAARADTAPSAKPPKWRAKPDTPPARTRYGSGAAAVGDRPAPRRSQDRTPPASHSEAAPAVPSAQQAPPPQPTSASAKGGELAVFPWDEFHPKLRVPSRTVWTYWELGLDFGLQPNAARRALFQKITEVLPWPPGSVAFWPLSFEHQGELIANRGSFLKGVRETQAGIVVVFGERAFKVLKPRTTYAHGRHDLSGKTLIALPGPGALLSGDATAKRIVWDTLRKMRF